MSCIQHPDFYSMVAATEAMRFYLAYRVRSEVYLRHVLMRHFGCLLLRCGHSPRRSKVCRTRKIPTRMIECAKSYTSLGLSWTLFRVCLWHWQLQTTTIFFWEGSHFFTLLSYHWSLAVFTTMRGSRSATRVLGVHRCWLTRTSLKSSLFSFHWLLPRYSWFVLAFFFKMMLSRQHLIWFTQLVFSWRSACFWRNSMISSPKFSY